MTLEGTKAFRCGQIADHICRSHVIRYNTHGGPFVGITTVTDNKNFLCLENVVWVTNYIKKKKKKSSTKEELSPVQKKKYNKYLKRFSL